MISVCIATYNGERYIKQQLESIINQLGPEDEIIISDDSSTDATLEIIRNFKDSRIIIFDNQKFKSPILNFENAIMHSSGDFIFTADQDDVWMPNKVKEILPLLESNLLVHTNAQVVDSNLNEVRSHIFESVPKSFIGSLVKNPFLGCTLAFRKEVKNLILPFPPRIAMHDIWIGMCVYMFSKPFYLDKNLIQYRRHGGNVSNASTKSEYSYIFRIKYRLYLLWSLLLRYIKIKFSKNGCV